MSLAADLQDVVEAWWNDLTPAENRVVVFLAAFLFLLFAAWAVGYLQLAYLFYLLALAGMYLLLSLGLNVQWGYTGLINFSVAAFFGIGAYGTALVTASNSPIAGGFSPLLGLVVGLAGAAVIAVLIGIPTLRLRADYLAIASLGLAEVVRSVITNQVPWTNGSSGISGIPRFYANWPVVGDLTRPLPVSILNLMLVSVFVAVVYLFLRRIHRSPWGRVQRTIRADEDLAEALGKDTYRRKMQSFVIGSVIMALAGVFYAHLTLYLGPGDLDPIRTFYVWIAVILGGSGSNRGAMFGGFTIIAILEGTRFLNGIELIPFDIAPLRLLAVGALIILIIRFRPEGVLPPQDELIWPDSLRGETDE
ncbi:branched-chain amino acid ABC transporter permease [Halobacteriaceae archaeon GCM10025711]